jgi:hypothetical protein
MTLSVYNETRKNPTRIINTVKGKKLVEDFTDTVINRSKIEHPNYDWNKKGNIIITVLFLFIKYLINYEFDLLSGSNSSVYLFVELSNGEKLFTHNILEDDKMFFDKKTQFAKDIINIMRKITKLEKKVKK